MSKFTKEHYDDLAKLILDFTGYYDTHDEISTICDFTDSLCNVLETDNRDFNRERFLKASGIWRFK